MTIFIHSLLLLFLALLCFGSLLSLSSSPHWIVRGWDFPRTQIIVIAWALLVIYFVVGYFSDAEATIPPWLIILLTVLLTVWHAYQIAPYTVIAPKQAKSTDPAVAASGRADDATVRVVISNLQLENDHYQTWIETMRKADPDIMLLLEPDQKWIEAIEPLLNTYPHQVIRPQDNWYGIAMLSRLPIENHRVRTLVQQDVPSIDAEIRLKDGSLIRVVGVHPRPPEPVRDNDAKARDAELTLWGRELAEETRPVIIGGDLNDVAWSQTTRLFLRTSGMLDPRRGRGLFNTFHARHFYMRFPLDHVFHSPHFTINNIRRLEYVGSDHFPILIDLRYSPAQRDEQEVLQAKPSDDQEADERIERAVEDEQLNGDAVDSSEPSIDAS